MRHIPIVRLSWGCAIIASILIVLNTGGGEAITESLKGATKQYRNAAQALEHIQWGTVSNGPLLRVESPTNLVLSAFGGEFTALRPRRKMKEAAVAGIGRVNGGDFTFTKGTKDSKVILRIKVFECDSATAVRKHVLQFVESTFSGGIPPQDKSVQEGDAVLCRQDLSIPAQRVPFIVFFNNVGLICDVSSDGKEQVNGIETLRRLAEWAERTSKGA